MPLLERSTMSDNKTVLISSISGSNALTNFTPKSNFIKSEPSKQPQRGALFQKTKPVQLNEENPYLLYAKPIFKQIDTLLHTYEIKNIQDTQVSLKEIMDVFVEKCTYSKLEHAQIMVARYLLCTFMDELVCTTYWGKEHNWSHQSLLNFYYQETYGGEKFFQLLGKMLPTPATNIFLLELMYVCISLGFEGKYRIHSKGKMELDAIRDNLYKQIKSYQGKEPVPFYSQPKPSQQNHLFFYKVPYLKLLIASFAILLLCYSILSFPLLNQENKVMDTINLAMHQNNLSIKRESYAKN